MGGRVCACPFRVARFEVGTSTVLSWRCCIRIIVFSANGEPQGGPESSHVLYWCTVGFVFGFMVLLRGGVVL